MPKLTKRIVDAAEVRPTDHFVWDDELPGFGLRVLPSGRKGYIVQYRAGRRSRRISLGPSTALTCEQARTRAMAIIAAAKAGEDPAAQRAAERKAVTVAELADRFDKEHIAHRVKPSTAKEYRRNLKRFIPTLPCGAAKLPCRNPRLVPASRMRNPANHKPVPACGHSVCPRACR